MQDAFLNLFNFFISNIKTPLANALINSNLLNDFYSFVIKFISAFFRLWNNDNNIVDIEYLQFCGALADLICVFLLVFCLWFVLKIFISIYNIISKGLAKC